MKHKVIANIMLKLIALYRNIYIHLKISSKIESELNAISIFNYALVSWVMLVIMGFDYSVQLCVQKNSIYQLFKLFVQKYF